MKKITLIIFCCLFSIFGCFVCLNVNFSGLTSVPENNILSYADLEYINQNDIFGRFINTEFANIKVGNDKKTYGKMWFKLFGIIPIKQVDVEITKGEEVYVGGIPLGFSIKTQGLIVVGNNSVLSENGNQNPNQSIVIKDGDIITKINNSDINNFDDVKNALANNCGEAVDVVLLREGKEINCTITPKLDSQSSKYKIGLWVKDDANGIGTLTYVKCDDKRFGALGHAITDYDTGIEIPISEGKIYKCSLVGLTKAEKNNPGELRCIFLQGTNHKGKIEKNTKFGVYGEVTDLSNIIDTNLTLDVGSRLTVTPGKATIVSSASGVRESYEIEIIKTSYQPESDDKSFVFRVTDERLLKLTGGILQGMSGSPIIQNGKLIGAVTHVFVSDPTKGYGIYADWMINE